MKVTTDNFFELLMKSVNEAAPHEAENYVATNIYINHHSMVGIFSHYDINGEFEGFEIIQVPKLERRAWRDPEWSHMFNDETKPMLDNIMLKLDLHADEETAFARMLDIFLDGK